MPVPSWFSYPFDPEDIPSPDEYEGLSNLSRPAQGDTLVDPADFHTTDAALDNDLPF